MVMRMIKADKGTVEIKGSAEVVAAEMIAIINDFVAWANINSELPGSELQNLAISLYETWKHGTVN